jgi:sulfur-carrier protein adenylyltransferase/sulfurtransferase
MSNSEPFARYARQTILPEVGIVGQNKLANARVLVVGAGGLGCPALQYLAGAGVGQLTIVDADNVSESNLHRQPLYGSAELGQNKAASAAAYIDNLNTDVHTNVVEQLLTPANVGDLLAEVDVALDCADSFAASYVLSDACFAREVPMIAASALGTSGYVGGFCAGSPSLRAVFPDLPRDLATCATAGVLGPVVGVLGAMQAQMALSVLLALTPSPLGQLVSFDAKTWRSSSFRFDGAAEPTAQAFVFVAPDAVVDNDQVIELRGEEEAPQPAITHAVRASVEDFENQTVQLDPNRRTVLCCRSGLRAWRAAAALSQYSTTPIALLAAGDAE